jgi:anti-sigma factor RsiW
VRRRTRALTCRQLVDALQAYVAGELDADDLAAFEAHLGDCPECTAYLRAYAATVRLARDAHAEPPPPPESLVRAVLELRRRRARPSRRSRRSS